MLFSKVGQPCLHADGYWRCVGELSLPTLTKNELVNAVAFRRLAPTLCTSRSGRSAAVAVASGRHESPRRVAQRRISSASKRRS